MKRVLITGAAGFVGSHIVDHLIANTDWQLVGLDSFRHRGDFLRIHPDSTRYQVFFCDLNAPISHRIAHQIGQIDYVLNLASESHVDRSISNPVPFIQNNVNLVLSIFEYCRWYPVEKIIQVSTDEVYGAAPEGTNHKEWSPILPSNPYSASKAAQEAIAISYWRTYGLPIVITNTMNMFGERQDPEKFIPSLISKISQNKVVTIHGNEQYIGKRHYLHARNFADALLFLLKNHTPNRYQDTHQIEYPSRFNIVGEVELNNLELADIVLKMVFKNQNKIPLLDYELVDFHHARPGHDRRYSLDGSLISSLGWKQPYDFKTSLEKTIEWTLKNQLWMD